jgi:hypothetical protein
VGSNATLIAISQLPASEQITVQEMKTWFEKTNIPGLQPQWDKGVEAFYHGRQLVEIPTSADAALFFTKSKGVLNVEAYKWLDKAPGARLFSGNVFYYSFASNKLKARVYTEGKLTRGGVFDGPPSAVTADTTSNDAQPTTAPAYTSHTRYTIFDWIACVFGGGTWVGFETGCRPGQRSWWGDVLDWFATIFTFGDDAGGGGGEPAGDGGSFTSSNNTIISISSEVSGGQSWVTVNSPCDNPADAGPGTIGGDGSVIYGPCDNSGTDLVNIQDQYNTYDTYTGDETDEPDDGNNSYAGPTEHIPSQIRLDNGQVVSVEFGTTASDNKYADNPVSVKLVNLLIAALNTASKHVIISKIYIAATTNGKHANNPPLHVSNHYGGLAIDLSRINGIPLAVQGASDVVQQMQLALDQSPDIRENFGPYFKHKFGQPYNTTDGSDHIHFSTNP